MDKKIIFLDLECLQTRKNKFSRIKIKRLSKICKITGAKLVLTSSDGYILWSIYLNSPMMMRNIAKYQYGFINSDQLIVDLDNIDRYDETDPINIFPDIDKYEKLNKIILKYNIHISGITITKNNIIIEKEKDILKWIKKHNLTANYVILDRENRFKNKNNHLVPYNIHSILFNGLQNKQLKQSIKILNQKGII